MRCAGRGRRRPGRRGGLRHPEGSLMQVRWVVGGLVALLVGAGTASAVDKDRLRSAACFPSVRAEFGIGFQYGRFHTMDGKVSAADEIQAVRKKLKGDAGDAEHYLRMGDLNDAP